MALYKIVNEAPPLSNMTLVYCLDGWVDAGMAAQGALSTLLEAMRPLTLATFDTDALLDHRARRPSLLVKDGINKGLTWPQIKLELGLAPDFTNLLVLHGPEPDHHWQRFSGDLAGLASELDVKMGIGLGAFPAPAPHTRHTKLTTTATTAELAEIIGYQHLSVEVPAGAQAAIEAGLAKQGIEAVGLWARVPHYASAMNYPSASVALLEGVAKLSGSPAPLDALLSQSSSVLAKITELVSANPEHEAALRELERGFDLEDQIGPGPLPSGDELAAEVEKWLRQGGQDSD